MNSPIRFLSGLFVVAYLLFTPHVMAAPVDISTWQLSGSAALSGSDVILTQAVNNQSGRVTAPAGFCASEFRMTFDINVGSIISSSGGTGIGLLFLNSNGQMQFRAHADTFYNVTEDQRYELNENHISIESLGAPSDLFGQTPPAGTMAFGGLAAATMPFRMEGAGWFKGEIHKKGTELTVQFLDGTRGLVLRSNVLYIPGEILTPAFEGLTTTVRNEHRIRNVDLQVIERAGCTVDPVPLTREETSALILSVCGDTTACPDRSTHLSCVDLELGNLLNEGQISQETADIVRLESETGLSYCEGYNQCLVDIDPDAIRSQSYDEGYTAGVASVPVEEIRQTAFDEGRTQGDSEGHARGLSEGQALGYASGYSEGLAVGDAAGYSRGHAEGRATGHAEGRAQGFTEGRAEGHAAGYSEGQAAGDAAGYSRGFSEGNAAGRAEGLAEGRAEGHAAGYAEGEAAGDAAGFERGHAEGRAAGYQEGYAAGESAGDAAGYSRGFEAGESHGRAQGYTDGYSAGESAGHSAGYAQGLSAGDAAGYTRGFSEGDVAGYSRGVTDGRAEGYTAGYSAGEQAGTAAGYEQGRNEGYQAGFQAGDSAGFTRGLQQGEQAGYQNGYEEGYEVGQAEGYPNGFEAGKEQGYEEGFEAAEQMCEKEEQRNKITLNSECSNNPDKTRKWSVSNPFKFPIIVYWSLDKSDQKGLLYVRPRATNTFETRTIRGDNTMRIYILGRQSASKTSTGKKCGR